ncbi:MAG TPA: ATP-binding protein [Acidimicrobiales bacterium]
MRGTDMASEHLEGADAGVPTKVTEATRVPEELRLLQQATRAVADADDVTAALEHVLHIVVQRTGWPYAAAWLPDGDGDGDGDAAGGGLSLVSSGAWFAADDGARQFRRVSEHCRFNVGEGIVGEAWASKALVRVDHVADPRFIRRESALGARFDSGIAVPLLAGDDVVAVMEFFMRQGEVLDDTLVEVVSLVAAHLGAVVRRRQLEDEVNHVQQALRQSNEELQTAVAELERSNADLAEFAYVASHDLSEPLRVISGHVQLLARRYEGQLGDDADRYISFAVDGCHRMQALISDLLAYSRVGQGPLVRKPVDLGRVVSEVQIGLGAALAETDGKVDVGELPSVAGDPGQLRQLFGNLIGNALKFTEPGTVPSVEVVGATGDDDTVRISVVDHGIGVPERHRERIFRMFQRLQRREDYAGTGIGLAICRRICDRHGGRIEVEDTPGGGATFVVTLPAPSRSTA